MFLKFLFDVTKFNLHGWLGSLARAFRADPQPGYHFAIAYDPLCHTELSSP